MQRLTGCAAIQAQVHSNCLGNTLLLSSAPFVWNLSPLLGSSWDITVSWVISNSDPPHRFIAARKEAPISRSGLLIKGSVMRFMAIRCWLTGLLMARWFFVPHQRRWDILKWVFLPPSLQGENQIASLTSLPFSFKACTDFCYSALTFLCCCCCC